MKNSSILSKSLTIYRFLNFIIIVFVLSQIFKIETNSTKINFLGFIIPAILTIATLLFTAILMALQMASVQFAPRIVRGFFIEDPTNQGLFFSFLLGITFCSGVYLCANDNHIWLNAAIWVSFLLISVAFPFFVFRIIKNLNAATITFKICERTIKEIDDWYGFENWKSGDDGAEKRSPKVGNSKIHANRYGFLDFIDYKKLSKITQNQPDIEIFITPIVGNFISKGEELVRLQIKNHSNPRPPATHLIQSIQQCFLISEYRSFHQDIQFGVRQLVDIAIKAISPAVNDPTTAVNCIHYLGEIVRRFTIVRLPSKKAIDEANYRIHVNEFDFDKLVDHAFDQIYQWGKHDSTIVRHILVTLTHIMEDNLNPTNLQILKKQVDDMEIKWDFCTTEFNENVRRALQHFYQKTLEQTQKISSFSQPAAIDFGAIERDCRARLDGFDAPKSLDKTD